MIEGRCWALLSLFRAAVLSWAKLSGQKLASACRLSQAQRNSTGLRSGEYGGKNAIWTSPPVESIRHQGRAKSVDIAMALSTPNPLASLLKLGEPKYHERLLTLKREIDRLRSDGTFGHRHYDLATRDFV